MTIAADAYSLLPAERAGVAEASRAACQAILSPAEPGGWPHGWRHAVAARICLMHGQTALATARLASVDDAVRPLADPAFAGRDSREMTVLAFVDRVAREPAQVAAEEIEALKAAGVDEADIVRLCELAAYMAFECRVAAGLALMQEVR